MITTVTEPNNAKSPDAELASAKAELQKKIAHRKKTIGEKIFNWGVYQGVGWGANEVGSMWFTGMFERGKNSILGEARFEQWSKGLAKKINFDNGQNGAKNLLMWISLNVIGCFVVPAIKILDGHKTGIVHWLNNHFDNKNKTQAEIEARDKETTLAIACEPTQSWTTLIVGRLAAMATAAGLVGHFILNPKWGKNGLTGNERLKKGFDEVSSAVGRNIGLAKWTDAGANYYSKIPQPQANEVNAFHYYSGLAGPETVGCLVSSTVLEVVSKYVAKKHPLVKNPEICAKAVSEIMNKKQNIKAKSASYTEQITSDGAPAIPAFNP